MNLELALNTGLLSPQGVALSGTTLAVCDTGNHRLALYDVAAFPSLSVAHAGGLGTDPGAEGMLFPSGACFIAADELIVADTQNRHLDRYKLQAGIWVFQNSLLAGAGNGVGYITDVAKDGANGILVLDATNLKIHRYQLTDGSNSEHLDGSGWTEPVALTVEASFLWVVDAGSHRILRYDAGFNKVEIGLYGSAPGALRAPRGIAVDSAAGEIYVAEADNNRISRFDLDGSFIEAHPIPPGAVHDLQKLTLDGAGRLYVADAGANAVYVYQTAAANALPNLSAAEVDFGFVGIDYELPQPVTLRNPGSSPIQVLSIEVSGDAFQLPVSLPSAPFTVPAGGDVSVSVVYAPTQPGLQAGELKIVIDHSDAPRLFADLRGQGKLAEPMSVALALDRSGSMTQASGVLSKIERLRDSASMLADLLRTDAGDEVSLVSFATSGTVEFGRDFTDAAAVNAVKGRIASLQPGGMTSIGDGLQFAKWQLDGSLLRRRNIVVLSDGKENTSPMLADFDVDPDTRIFTVGLGLPQYLNAAALEQLATTNGGYFQITDGNDHLLAKFFIQIASDIFGQQIALDPLLTLESGATVDVPVHVSSGDIDVTAYLTWDPRTEFDVRFVTPGGYVMGWEDMEVVASSDRYLVVRAQHRGTRWEKPGRWNVRVHCGRSPQKTVSCVLAVSVSSDHWIEWNLVPVYRKGPKFRRPETSKGAFRPRVFPPVDPRLPVPPGGLRVGDKLLIEATAVQDYSGLKILGGELTTRYPSMSLSREERRAVKIDLDYQRECRAPRHEGGKERVDHSKMKAGKRADTTAGEIKLDGHDGIYEVQARVLARTPSGDIVQRERRMQVLVRP